jgi:hypothetical protein
MYASRQEIQGGEHKSRPPKYLGAKNDNFEIKVLIIW